MKNLLKKANKELELIKKHYLEPFEKEGFETINVVIGKNGSGKTRMLNFLQEFAQKEDCSVIKIDCTKKNEQKIKEKNEVVERMLFEISSNDLFNDLFGTVIGQLNDFFISLKEIYNVRQTVKINTILSEINRYLIKIMKREIFIEDKELYIYNKETSQKRIFLEEIDFLSPGERNILAFALSIICIKLDKKKKTLILIDEIEMHLHPAALLDIYEMFCDNLEGTNCCVFIATHSVFLLPLVKFENILYFEHGKLQPVNGKLYQNILNSLLYENEAKNSIMDFFASIDAWSYAEFMAECLCKPSVTSKVSNKDPQYLKFEKKIKEKIKQEEILEILDYGAGDARIGQCFELANRSDDDKFKIKYHVYDKYFITEKFIPNTSFYGNAYSSKEDLEKNKNTFDIVLLYNVLHEVGIDEWVEEINFILSLLREEGVLIFSERKTLSVGEKPYGKSGYLVLGENEIEKLFEGFEIESISLPQKIRDVTICFGIKKNPEIVITEERIKDILEVLKNRMETEIDGYLDEEKNSLLKPREYAFCCQQYFNVKKALILLDEINKLKKKDFRTIMSDTRIGYRERLELIKRRARINDSDGKECKKYLKLQEGEG